MGIAGHKNYKHELTEEDKARNEAQELLNKIQDPRYQPREKMHYMKEAYEKYGGAEGLAKRSGKGGPGTPTEAELAKLAEMEQRLKG